MQNRELLAAEMRGFGLNLLAGSIEAGDFDRLVGACPELFGMPTVPVQQSNVDRLREAHAKMQGMLTADRRRG
jgi:hypothetical protein